ncbi:ATP-grasp domain-containing protein [Candidatus Dojkabacteria bacterium]|jgi:cyanophycin synthetase|nr:ATP-grasp domain-containing protein [Candidatus Dojkabacteria bacterium]
MEKNYLDIAGNIHLSYFLAAADKLGIGYQVIIPHMTARFTVGNVHWFINNTAIPLNNAPSCRLARAKNLASQIMRDANIPVPKQKILSSEIDAISFFGQYKEIVIKPSQNLGGHGVSILPKNEHEVIESFKFAQENDKQKRVIGEEFIQGDNFRLLVLGDKVISSIKRNPARIIGDGVNTVAKLIEMENERRSSRNLMAIKIDTELMHKLESQSLTLESIPKKDEFIPLRSNANMTTGGTTQEIEEVNPYYKSLAIQAVMALDLVYGGVDLITPDITKEAKCAVNEVNYNPGLRLHYIIDEGTPKDVALTILEYIKEEYTK